MNIKLFLILTSVLFLTISTQAAAGELDCSFGTRGKTTTALGGLSSDIALDVVVQPDEKVIVVGLRNVSSGPADSVVIRYRANGTLDTSFDSDGILILPVSPTDVDQAHSVAIQPDGKIVVAGYAYNNSNTFGDFYVLRLNSNGSFDTTFGIGGKILTDFNGQNDYGYSMVIQPDGKIIVGGSAGDTTGNRLRFGLVRYNPDGSLDTEFGDGGKVQTIFFNFDNNIFDIALQADGKIVAVGNSFTGTNTDFAVLRFNTDGTPDNSFDGDGKLLTVIGGYESALSVAIQPDGKIVIAGHTTTSLYEDIAIIRYNSDGSLDTSFDGDGKLTTAIGPQYDFGREIFIQPDGKLLVIGHTLTNTFGPFKYNFVLLRYNSNGLLDTTFNNTGYVITSIGTIEDKAVAAFLMPNGKVVAVGYSFTFNERDFAVVRYSGEQSAICSEKFDFDGNGKSDISVYRPSNGVWYLLNSQTGFMSLQFGISTDQLAPADFDGDGKTDIAVYRDGTWFIQRSTLGFTAIQFGIAEDIPQPSDFDGDGRAEIAVYRPSNGTWYVFNLANNQFTSFQFGISEDKPVVGDYDGDGRADYAVFRPSNGIWYYQQSTAGFGAIQFGLNTDKPVPADYDGDRKTDVAVYRPSNGIWYYQRSTTGFGAIQFGLNTDRPAPADYDGDGRADIAVFRPSNGIWYVQQSTLGFTGTQFGIAEDKPIPNAFVP